MTTLSAEYYRLGIALNLKPSKLKAIQKQYPSDVQQAFDDVLYAWLRWKYHKKHGPPTWRMLVKAVDKINPALAKTIATAHPLEGKSGLRSLLYPWGGATLFTLHVQCMCEGNFFYCLATCISSVIIVCTAKIAKN